MDLLQQPARIHGRQASEPWRDLAALVVRRLLLGAGSDVLADHWSGSGRDLRRLVSAVDRLGSLLPDPVRRILESFGRR